MTGACTECGRIGLVKRGMCTAHYTEWWRSRSQEERRQPTTDERYWAKVDKQGLDDREAGGGLVIPAAAAARAVLLDAGVPDSTSLEHVAGHLARTVIAQGEQTELAEFRVRLALDAHGIGTENHPETWALATELVAAVRKETP